MRTGSRFRSEYAVDSKKLLGSLNQKEQIRKHRRNFAQSKENGNKRNRNFTSRIFREKEKRDAHRVVISAGEKHARKPPANRGTKKNETGRLSSPEDEKRDAISE